MAIETPLLREADGPAVTVENSEGSSKFVFVCEHASNKLPASLDGLGLNASVLDSHVAWDPGALAVARILAQELDAPLIFQQFSRLVYDCNRPPDAPGAMPDKSEIYDIPGNRQLSDEARAARVKAIYEPFHRSVSDVLSKRQARGQESVFVTVHSFTPVYFGTPRTVEIGVLHDEDSRLADAMLQGAAKEPTFAVRRNDPYGPEDGVTHTLKLHTVDAGLLNVMIEIRNDLIADETGQMRAAGYLAGLLTRAVSGIVENVG